MHNIAIKIFFYKCVDLQIRNKQNHKYIYTTLKSRIIPENILYTLLDKQKYN